MPVPVIPLSGALRLPDAPGLVATLGAALAEGDLDIDATALEAADAGIVQVLVAAACQAGRQGRQFRLTLPAAGAVRVLVERMELAAVLTGPRAAQDRRAETEA
jgi:anti-anti-sigma regulatory factor